MHYYGSRKVRKIVRKDRKGLVFTCIFIAYFATNFVYFA
jgi:hypothetical protein